MAIPQKKPWAILVCKFSDDKTDPAKLLVRDMLGITDTNPNDPQTALDLFNMFFTKQGNNTFNAVRYFNEMSHGSIDLNDSQVFVCNVNLTLAQGSPSSDPVDGTAYELLVTQAAKAAAIKMGVQLNNFFGIVITSHVMLSMSQGSPNFDGTPWAGMDYRWVKNNGMQSWGQEMGHGFGLDHSRMDGSTVDYLDFWDVMSTIGNAFSATDPNYGARGPGINAWNMRCRGWLDETRVWHCPNNTFDQTIQLRPLHRHDLTGFLAAELPPMNDTDGFPKFLVEFRKKEGWDSGIPHSCILVHRFEGVINQALKTHSYIMPGTNGKNELLAGDLFSPLGDMGPSMTVVSIDENANTATVKLTMPSLKTNVAPTLVGVGNSIYLFGKHLDGRIFHKQALLGQAFSAWAEVEGKGHTDAAIGAGAIGTYLFLEAKGIADGNVYLNQADIGAGRSFGNWISQNFKTDKSSAAVGVGNSIYLFAKHIDGRIFFNHAVLTQGFSGWAEVEGKGKTDAAPSAGAIGSYVFVAVKGIDGTILLNQADKGAGTTFGQWFPLNFKTDVAPALVGVGNKIYIFAKHIDGRIFSNHAILGQAFVGWTEVEGAGRTDASPTAGAIGNYVFVGVKGLDGNIYLNQADIGAGRSFGQWFAI